jgi:hypothetical protein
VSLQPAGTSFNHLRRPSLPAVLRPAGPERTLDVVRDVTGRILVWLGWMLIWYFAILAFILLMGIAHAPRWVAVFTSSALLAGIALVLGGNYLRERGVVWRSRRERQMREAEHDEGPFGHPRGEA